MAVLREDLETTHHLSASAGSHAGIGRRHPLALTACLFIVGCADAPPSHVPLEVGGGNIGPPAVLSPARPEPAAADVFSLLEKPFKGSEVTAFTQDMRQCSIDGNAAIVCPMLGVRLRLDGNDVIRSVDAYPNVMGDYLRPYTGPLPHGILGSDRRELLRGKLGTPDASADNWDRFTVNGRWVFIEYFPSASPKAGLISEIQLSRPR